MLGDPNAFEGFGRGFGEKQNRKEWQRARKQHLVPAAAPGGPINSKKQGFVAGMAPETDPIVDEAVALVRLAI